MTSELVTEQDVVPPTPARPVPGTSARAAAVTFGVVEVVGFIVYVIAARRIWFFRDDWDFLAGRSLNVSDLLRQHGGHLVALPLVVFRGLYFVVGLRSYLPYQLLAIGLHLTAAALLRAVMRRSGVNPWIATVAASAFVLFGTASQDILWAFQIAFTGPLVLGLVQLLLADHDGPIDRRDWIGIIAGAGALLCSGVGVTMVGMVGLAALVKRGWRPALFHTAPLGVLYAAWWLHYARNAGATVTDVSVLADWVRTGITGAFDALGQVPFVGWAIAAMLVMGLVLAWRQYDWSERRRLGALPGSMLVGAFAFILISGVNRAWVGTRFASSSRYLHIVVALLLPSLAVAADALVRKSRGFIPLVLALFLVGVPGNLASINDNFFGAAYFAGYRQMVRSLPRMALAARVPADVRPDLVNGPWITVGWLRDGARSGRIPGTRAPTPNERATNRLRLSLDQLDEGSASQCSALRDPLIRHLELNQSIVVRGSVSVRLIDDTTGRPSSPIAMGVSFLSGAGLHTLKDVAGPLTIQLTSPGAGQGMVCEGSR